jgi:SNF2 family DNA or RNA helicase
MPIFNTFAAQFFDDLMDTPIEKYVVVYSLNKAEGLDIYLPSAYICSVDKYDRPGYIQAAALAENIKSYGIDIENSVHKEMITLCHELSLSELEKSFNKNKKKPEKLSSLFADPKIQKTIQGLIDRRMNKFIELVKNNKCYLCHQLVRKVNAYDLMLGFFLEHVQPHLLFTKTQTGIRYELKLRVGETQLKPIHHDIALITNMPGIIILDKIVMWLSDINTSKLKPFLKAESVFIPDKLVKNYFSQFVLDVMGKADVESDGFDIQKLNSITSQHLTYIYDFLEDKWLIDVRFDYEEFSFLGSEQSKKKTRLKFDKNDNITVLECTRDKNTEDNLIQVLLSLGFKKLHNNRFIHNNTKFSVLEKTSAEIEKLKTVFEIHPPESDGKQLTFGTFTVLTNFVLINDWFDLKGMIKIGDVEYPISRLFRNIKNDDPFYRLSDGSFVLIPGEIMTKYEPLVRFAVEGEDKWKLSKTHFTLLESFGNPLNKSKLKIIEDDVTYVSPSELKAQLRPYQIQGVKWLIKHQQNKMGGLLADDMGLGKTLQTIAALLYAKENKTVSEQQNTPVQLDLFGAIQTTGRKSLNALIILPASLIFNWYAEIKKYAPSLQVVQYTGAQRKKVQKTLMTFDVILTTYQTVVSDFDILKPFLFHYIVLDESQQIRNKNSKVFNAVHQLNSEHRLSLSGTPIENSLSDLWSQMEFINPSVLGSYTFFKEQFQVPIERYRNEKAIAELKKLVDPFILRRTKGQVAKDLPDLIEKMHFAEMTEEQAKCYEKEKSSVRNYLAGLDRQNGQYRFHVLSSLMKLRQIANHPIITKPDYQGESGKFEDIKDQIRTIVRSGHKVLIFSSFLSHLDLYVDWLQAESTPYLLLTGSMTGTERENAVMKFQNDPTFQVFLLSIKAGGTGLNLTAADYVFILDPWWNPFVEMQAIARAHRIGRKNNVIVTRVITKATLEEKIMRLQDKKRTLSDDVIDINELPELSDSELEELLT